MRITTIFFDMDGTLLPINQEEFVKDYFETMVSEIAPLGYEPEKLKDTIIKGTFAMVNGDGTRINSEIFWEFFCKEYGEDAVKDKPHFDRYYETTFDSLKKHTFVNPKAVELIKMLRAKGIKLVLATNPLFPPLAIQKRLSWAGLSHTDFELYSTYENATYCKPNPMYYKEIMQKLNLTPDECIMVGNDVDNDMTALDAGIDVFLVTDFLLSRKGADYSKYPQGNFDELISYITNKIGG